jgi:nucleoside-diphosphate-sugar epimerase
LASTDTGGETLNAVSLHPSVNDIAQTLQRIVPDATVYYTDQDVFTEISFDADSSKLQALGFVPQYDLEYGLREILARWRGF